MATQSAAVLITRPKSEGDAFAAALVARFGPRVRPVVSPLLAPRNLTPDLPDQDYAAVVFTSAQAVEAAGPYLPRLPRQAWCVGAKTARAASLAGFDARSGGGDGDALVRALAADPPKGSILYLRGVDTAFNLLERLREFGIDADEAVVYLQSPQDLGPEALDLLRQRTDVIVPLFSPRSARLFRAALPKAAQARLHIAAMSANVAEALQDLPRAHLTIALRPDAPAMLDAVETLLVQLPAP
ncbi:uroporphyrinogen-III synthase [Tabrizicola sp.]|uniref:uroporphyrinogen-III synthase n=1 Tax=Tabrizicola sp. TaxID=2005166 RepID=UPI0035AF4373